MIRRIGLITLALLWLLGPSLVAAAAGITVTASNVDVNFPSQAMFTVEAESNVNIVDVRLYYQVDKMSYAEVVSEGWADFTSASKIEANWVWDMRNASLPPGAEVTYWWMIEDADGNRFETSPQTMHFDDDNMSRWLFVCPRLPNFLNEIKHYRYKKKDNIVTDEPHKKNDHLMDCWRYLASYQGLRYRKPSKKNQPENYALQAIREKKLRRRQRGGPMSGRRGIWLGPGKG